MWMARRGPLNLPINKQDNFLHTSYRTSRPRKRSDSAMPLPFRPHSSPFRLHGPRLTPQPRIETVIGRISRGVEMAESGTGGGSLGGEEEASPERRSPAEASPASDGLAAAIAAVQSGADPAVASAARAILEKEGELIQLRMRHLEEEHQERLAQRRSPPKADPIEQLGQIARICSQASTALVVTAIAVSVLIAVWDAFQSRSVVIAAFKAPAALAGRGLTGDVVAARVQDALQRLKEATHSATKAYDVETTWAPDLKIEVPETGLSIDEVEGLLTTLFGHDLHIGGDLVQTVDGGLTLTVRGDGISPRSFGGGPAELDALTVQAAEYVYGRSQPAPFAAYLVNNFRYREALDFLPGAFARADSDIVQAELATSWGDALAYLNKPAQSVAKYRMALALNPHDWEAWSDLAVELALAEGEETAW